MAQFETEIRAERILAGQQAARANGKRWGGSKAGRHTHRVTPETMRTLARMEGDGESKSVMARVTGLSRTTIYALLGELQTAGRLNGS